MAAGDLHPRESRTFHDPETGVEITQLTDHKAHSHHTYFTNPGWYDDGRSLLFASDRGGGTNLYGLDLHSHDFRQLTELTDGRNVESNLFHSVSVNPTRPEAYFWHGRELVALHLHTLEQRILHTTPRQFGEGGSTNVTADGEFVMVSYSEDLSDRMHLDLGHGYVGFREYWEARPLSRVVRVSTTDGTSDVVHQDRAWIGHVNTSPSRPELLTFCHEGPWHLVDHRIWLLDLTDGSTTRIRPTVGEERVGHEYWLQDGLSIGYHGWSGLDQGRPFHGAVRYDGTEQWEAPLVESSMHFHSGDLDLIVGDGTSTNPQLMVWRREGDAFAPPRLLHRHRGSFHSQAVHVHPTVSPDRSQVVFTADARGYGNVHIATLPENLDSLPEVSPSAR